MTVLDNKDLESSAWAKIKAHYTARRQSLLEKLSGDLNLEETMKLRGRIRECSDVLKLEDREQVETQQPEF